MIKLCSNVINIHHKIVNCTTFNYHHTDILFQDLKRREHTDYTSTERKNYVSVLIKFKITAV